MTMTKMTEVNKMSRSYNFDEMIDRTGTNAMNTDGFRQYILTQRVR